MLYCFIIKILEERDTDIKVSHTIYGKWLIAAVSIISAAACLIVVGVFAPSCSTGSQRFPNIQIQNADDGRPYVSFDINYAKTGTPLNATVNNLSSTSSLTYQWYLNNDEIEGAVYSSYTPVESDLEKFISVEVKSGTSTYTASLYCSNLPVIYINSDDDINDEYTSAVMAVSGSDGYDESNSDFYRGGIQIKLRGNSTRYLDKSPYKIALDKKANLYGMGANKHWVLLANAIDHTLIRNKLVYDLSGQLGSDYMSSLNVVLVLNNDYRGVYQLCEQVRIDADRINITKWSGIAGEAAKAIADFRKETENMTPKAADDFADRLEEAMKKDLSWISEPHTFAYSGRVYVISDYADIPPVTGGYILEMDFYNFQNISSVRTNYNQPFYFNKPEPAYAITNPEMINYAKKHLQSFEYALHSYDFTYHNNDTHYMGMGLFYDQTDGWKGTTEPVEFDAPEYDGVHYTKLFDFQSLVNNWFICEFTMNWDSMKNSVFVTKEVDMPAKLSPAWDFDWAFGNRNMYAIYTNYPTGWHTTNDYFTNEQYYQSVQWNRFLIRDPYFLFSAYNKYMEIRPTLLEDIIKQGGTLDTYRSELSRAAGANDLRWGYTYPMYRGLGFEASYDGLRNFIDTRIDWLDEQFSSFDTFVTSTGMYIKSDAITVTECQASTGAVSVSVSDDNIKALKIQVNGSAYIENAEVTDGKADIMIPLSALNPEGLNIINVMGLDSDGSYITSGSSETVGGENVDLLYPVQNYKVF